MTTSKRRSFREPSLLTKILLQVAAIGILITVLFPIIWVFSVSLSPLNLIRPDGLNLIPKDATLESYLQVIERPTGNPVSFLELAFNSMKIAGGTALASVALGVLAAYPLSRLAFKGRTFIMLVILGVLMLPAVATLAPLFVTLNSIKLDLPILGAFNLRNSQLGVGIAIVSGSLPFAIWNLKGYLDTIPRELEEAAAVDGASQMRIFRSIVLPLALPAIAVTGFLGFISGWTEFYYSWMFLTQPRDFTLAMALSAMTGTYAAAIPWPLVSAFSIMLTLPPAIVYLLSQRFITGGLAVGSVKG